MAAAKGIPSPRMAGPITTERRIRAAMALAGIDSTDVLADRAELPWRGRTLRGHIADGTLTRVHLEPIARACGLPYEWFTADIPALLRGSGPAVEDRARLDRLEEAVDAILQALKATPAPAEEANGGPSLLDLAGDLPEGFPLAPQERRQVR